MEARGYWPRGTNRKLVGMSEFNCGIPDSFEGDISQGRNVTHTCTDGRRLGEAREDCLNYVINQLLETTTKIKARCCGQHTVPTR